MWAAGSRILHIWSGLSLHLLSPFLFCCSYSFVLVSDFTVCCLSSSSIFFPLCLSSFYHCFTETLCCTSVSSSGLDCLLCALPPVHPLTVSACCTVISAEAQSLLYLNPSPVFICILKFKTTHPATLHCASPLNLLTIFERGSFFTPALHSFTT